MADLLEDKIKAILSGEIISEKKDEQKPSDDDEELVKTKAGEEEEKTSDDQEQNADTDKDGDTDQDSDNDGDDGLKPEDGDEEKEPEKAKYKKDTSDEPTGKTPNKINVEESDMTKTNESAIPELGKDIVNTDKDESGQSKTAKTVAGQSRKLGDKYKLDMSASADSQDDNGDNARGKLTPNGAPKDSAGGKLSQNEHMEAMFSGEQLSEEFKTKAQTIFEAAVAAQVDAIVEAKVAALEEEYQGKFSEALVAIEDEIVEHIDDYLGNKVNEWKEDNEVALESGIRSELAESFIDELKTLFAEHYVDIPEGKTDVLDEQSTRIAELEAELAAIAEEKEIAEHKALELACESVITKHCAGLTAIEQDKFRELAENVEFVTEGEFAEKVKIIRESYFKGGKTVVAESTKQEVTKPVEEAGDITEQVLAQLAGGQINLFRKH